MYSHNCLDCEFLKKKKRRQGFQVVIKSLEGDTYTRNDSRDCNSVKKFD